MALYRLSAKVGTAGSGRAHFDYMTRNGKYSRHDSKSKEDLIYYESKNIPQWAKNDRDFWKEEEIKKDGFRKVELALPNECSTDEKIQMVKEYCETEFSDKYAYTFAIHENEGAISGEKNPHAHIMFSERKIDYERGELTRQEYFKRGGKKRDGTLTGGYRKDRKFQAQAEKSERWIDVTRKRWADIQNSYLERCGSTERVSEKSLKEQGIDRHAQKHIGYKAVGMYVRGYMSDKMEYYAAAKEQARLYNDEQEVDAAEQQAIGYAVARQKEKQEIDEYRQQLERERDRLLQEQNRRKLEREEQLRKEKEEKERKEREKQQERENREYPEDNSITENHLKDTLMYKEVLLAEKRELYQARRMGVMTDEQFRREFELDREYAVASKVEDYLRDNVHPQREKEIEVEAKEHGEAVSQNRQSASVKRAMEKWRIRTAKIYNHQELGAEKMRKQSRSTSLSRH